MMVQKSETPETEKSRRRLSLRMIDTRFDVTVSDQNLVEHDDFIFGAQIPH